MQKMASRMSPKDFFLHLAAMATLYVSAVSLLALIFEIINVLLRDPLEYHYDPYSYGIRWAIAAIIILFPLFLFLSHILVREYKTSPFKAELSIRKWLVYLTLFIAGVVLTVDLITLLQRYLAGEIETRFILKAAAVFVVASLIFSYYLTDLRGGLTMPPSVRRVFAAIAILMVIAAIVGGFVVFGSPRTLRLVRFDERRMNDLQSIQWQIVNFWQQKSRLPENLNELEDPISGFVVPRDPETGEEYQYSRAGALSFGLCAHFNRRSRDPFPPSSRPVGHLGFDSESWAHGVGQNCFSRTIDPDRYPTKRGQEAPRTLPD